MKSVIKEIFYGNRGQVHNVKMNEEYLKIVDKISDLQGIVINNLSTEKKSEIDELFDLTESLSAEIADIHFIEGVKLGMLLVIEAFN